MRLRRVKLIVNIPSGWTGECVHDTAWTFPDHRSVSMAPWRSWISQLTSNQKIVGSTPTGVFPFFASIFAYCELKRDNAQTCFGKRQGERGYV